MKILLYPGAAELAAALQRPAEGNSEIDMTVREILMAVRSGGDAALREFSEKFDGFVAASLRVEADEIEQAEREVSPALKKAILSAASNIEKFHLAGAGTARFVETAPEVTETAPGVRCWYRDSPIEKVGLYVPGGTAPLFSTVLMLGIPARLAGCGEIVMCTPPGRDGKINPLILYAAKVAGVKAIFRAGGAQAIAAMAYSTESIPAVYKIFGPGNRYVTRAKELVQLQGTAIDMPAGPSELMVIAGSNANPAFVAADLLSQAEHGTDSQVIMLTDSREMITLVEKETERQMALLPRKDIAARSLENSSLVLFKSEEKCLETANHYAPEHLIIATPDPIRSAERVTSAGSVFLGNYSSESTGDYMTGPNHTLPTGGFAKSFSGVTLGSFMKRIFFQEVTAEGIRNIGPDTVLMAEAEMLGAHAAAVSVRLDYLDKNRHKK
ncbi:MAG: histidinol dehydrogenase [Bacteroidales bacterium]|jgi:histidinol dehydrogenase|nr:histidinol dehydrogenase [Bacteroidales bacterium]HPE23402.1 histidinol dehydrogenase [Bacteroidales bacterium]HRW27779.1 histidinol dehydrogenase [Bacteroidales bacterium]